MGVLVDNAAKMKSQQVIAYFATLQLRNPDSMWGIEKFRPYLNPRRTVRHLGAVPRCSTNPDSMKGIRRGSTPPVGQKVRDSLLIIATRV